MNSCLHCFNDVIICPGHSQKVPDLSIQALVVAWSLRRSS